MSRTQELRHGPLGMAVVPAPKSARAVALRPAHFFGAPKCPMTQVLCPTALRRATSCTMKLNHATSSKEHQLTSIKLGRSRATSSLAIQQ